MSLYKETLNLFLNDSTVQFCFNNNLHLLGQFVSINPTIQILTLNQVVLNATISQTRSNWKSAKFVLYLKKMKDKYNTIFKTVHSKIRRLTWDHTSIV